MMGFAALLAYMSQCEKVNHAYTVSLSSVFLKVPKTLQVKCNVSVQDTFVISVMRYYIAHYSNSALLKKRSNNSVLTRMGTR